jgi:hypothetical protein
MAPGYGDRHDVRYTDQELLKSNVQLSTFNVVTERAHGGAGYGDRHRIRTTELLTRWTYPSAGRAVEAGCGTRIWGQTRCPVCRSGTFNVKRSTRNVQRGERNGAWRVGYGDRHGVCLYTWARCPGSVPQLKGVGVSARFCSNAAGFLRVVCQNRARPPGKPKSTRPSNPPVIVRQ